MVFLAFLVFFVFGVGVRAGGLGNGLLSRLGLPTWVRFPPPHPLAVFVVFSVFPAFWAFLVFSVFGVAHESRFSWFSWLSWFSLILGWG